MEMHRFLSALTRFLVLLPGAASCYLSAANRMRFTPAKAAALCAAVLLPYSAAAASLHALSSTDFNRIWFASLVPFFFLYRRTVDLDLPRALAIYTGVCAIETFPAQFACAFDAALHPASGAADLSPEAALLQLGLSCLLLAAFIRPATRHFARAVDDLDFPKIWYSTVTLSFVFLLFNVFAVPRSYATLHTGRMYRLFLVFETGALALLVGIYVLFYRGAVMILEHAKLKERSRLLEMQSRQYLALQEHMRRTAKLRHDFRHSIRLLAALAEQGDVQNIRAHIAEYETSLDRPALANYCKNAALNALFGYYQETAAAAGISTDWRIELPDPLPFSELDLTGLFGNLMENGNRLYIVSTNNFDGKTRTGAEGYLSTRHDGTGIGLASIAAVAEKYGGFAKASHSDNEFFVDVLLKI